MVATQSTCLLYLRVALQSDFCVPMQIVIVLLDVTVRENTWLVL